MTLCSRRRLLVCAAILSAMPALAWSSTYPAKPIRMVVPFAPGGASDVVARLVSQRLAEALKQPVVVENRPGANGIIGTDMVARAAPDGYTLLLNTAGAQTLSPVLYKAGYEPLKSFAPISLISSIGFVMVVHPSVPAKTVQEFVTLARAKSRPLSLSAGSSMIELIGETFKSTAGTPDVVSVSYRGTGPQMQAVVAGEVDMTIDPFNSMAMIRAGRLRPLAVLSPKRSPALPDVPTMQEAGIQGMNFNSWAGLLAPAGTPKEIVTRLNQEIVRIVAMPDIRERLAAIDYEAVGSTPEQFATIIADDAARWAKLVKDTNYKEKTAR
ncbi:Bug family tripartite tricarboxylate transporter substrate binding protein [Cupriavidus basilensis]|uniref:Tripartite tricarboxylate transporter substrate binding protein n=1 Tax=Cupriavidus basilensis TaxID=68895 RepID=A0A643FTM6_9BURK|nr:tripartite tricarboxylate transporter substrate binding protein [Cupriavidus basilensis]MCP3020840.1 tripartite tricarboxylate transporter substrate binding protein [Cupriavidus basilensis]QOT81021.1 tripartite tricarboxylate transporter substrate binding protein [Cupriavidus basilensis]